MKVDAPRPGRRGGCARRCSRGSGCGWEAAVEDADEPTRAEVRIVFRWDRVSRPHASSCARKGAIRPESHTLTPISVQLVTHGDDEYGVSTPGRRTRVSPSQTLSPTPATPPAAVPGIRSGAARREARSGLAARACSKPVATVSEPAARAQPAAGSAGSWLSRHKERLARVSRAGQEQQGKGSNAAAVEATTGGDDEGGTVRRIRPGGCARRP
jgi:hypothetical protein